MDTLTRIFMKILKEDIENEPPEFIDLLEMCKTFEDTKNLLQNSAEVSEWHELRFPKRTLLWGVVGGENVVFAYPDAMEDVDRFVYDFDIDDYFKTEDEDFNESFWQNPVILYHATDNENIKSIKKHGLSPERKTYSPYNRGTLQAVYTSTNEYAIDAYGDRIIKIDTLQMAQDGYTPEVSQEEDIHEDRYRSSMAWEFYNSKNNWDYGRDGEFSFIDSSQGTSDETVVVHGPIPKKYLSFIT